MSTASSTPRACLVFLLDRSASMREPPEGSWKGKAELVAAALNECLGLLIDQAREAGTEEAIDCGVIGYQTDRLARPVVGPIVGAGPLATLGAIGRSALRSEART